MDWRSRPSRYELRLYFLTTDDGITEYFDTDEQLKELCADSDYFKTSTKIVWNGCDNYIISDESVFTKTEEFKPFDVVEVDIDTLPVDEDGEKDIDGILGTECGRYFKIAWCKLYKLNKLEKLKWQTNLKN